MSPAQDVRDVGPERENEVYVYRTIEEANENQWNDAVESADGGSVFHRYGWLKAVEDGMDTAPRHVTVEKDGNLRALLPNFVTDFELPVEIPDTVEDRAFRDLRSIYPGFGGPLVVGDTERCLDQLFEGLATVEDGAVVRHQIRTPDTDSVQYAQEFERRGYQPYLRTCRFEVDLTRGWEEIESAMDSNKRSNLRRAKKNDPEITDGQLADEHLPSFYRAYEKNVERVGGTPYPRSFFERLARELPDRLRLFTARVDEQVVGRQLTVVDDSRDAVRVMFPALDAEHFQYYPGELLDEAGMRWARAHGYSTYDFGDTNADFSDGAFRYKREFGGRILPVLAWERGLSRLRWNAFKVGRRLYRQRNAKNGKE